MTKGLEKELLNKEQLIILLNKKLNKKKEINLKGTKHKKGIEKAKAEEREEYYYDGVKIKLIGSLERRNSIKHCLSSRAEKVEVDNDFKREIERKNLKIRQLELEVNIK